MPLKLIKEPVKTCSRCHHSIAVCTCDKQEPCNTYDMSSVTAIDWQQIIELDKQQQRSKLNLRHSEDTERNKLQRLYELEERNRHMPLKLINDAERKPRPSMQGKFSSLPEVIELWQTKLPEGKAIEVTIPPQTINQLKQDKVENPVRSIVAGIRRKIAADGLALEVYANDDHSFTVMRAAAKAAKKKAAAK